MTEGGSVRVFGFEGTEAVGSGSNQELGLEIDIFEAKRRDALGPFVVTGRVAVVVKAPFLPCGSETKGPLCETLVGVRTAEKAQGDERDGATGDSRGIAVGQVTLGWRALSVWEHKVLPTQVDEVPVACRTRGEHRAMWVMPIRTFLQELGADRWQRCRLQVAQVTFDDLLGHVFRHFVPYKGQGTHRVHVFPVDLCRGIVPKAFYADGLAEHAHVPWSGIQAKLGHLALMVYCRLRVSANSKLGEMRLTLMFLLVFASTATTVANQSTMPRSATVSL